MPIISPPQKNVIFKTRADVCELQWNAVKRAATVEIKPLHIGVVLRFVA